MRILSGLPLFVFALASVYKLQSTEYTNKLCGIVNRILRSTVLYTRQRQRAPTHPILGTEYVVEGPG